MKPHRRRAHAVLPGACALGVLLASAGARAVPNEDLSWRATTDTARYELNDDGSFTETHLQAVKLLTDQAAQQGKQRAVTYSTSVQKVDVIEAYTLKADGHRVPVPNSNYQVETNGGLAQGAAAFSDWSTLTLVFPDVAKGHTTVFNYRIVASQPMFPGQFSLYETFDRSGAYDDVRVEVDASKAMWARLRLRANGLRQGSPREHDGRRTMQWQWDNKAPEVETRHDWSVRDIDAEPGLSLSTFAGYGDVAAAYGAAARPRAAVTPRIARLADEIAKDARTPRETAQALYTWVARNITYAGNCVGLGAVVPRDTDFVLDNHMGDCKDHATLLQALLAARGIPSTQALVNAGSSFELPAIPVVSMVNHVIDYVPQLDLYLDSTSDSTPFGMLPPADHDKPTLLVDGYRDGTRTPRASHVGQLVAKTVVDIQEDGSARGQMDVATTGALGAGSRTMLRNMSKKDQADIVKNYFKSSGLAATGTFTMDDPADLLDRHRYGVTFDVAGAFSMPGSGATGIGPLFVVPVSIGGLIGAEAQRQPEPVAVTCGGVHLEEDTTVNFPKTVQVVFAPQPLAVTDGDFTYTASYVRSDHQVMVKRVLDDRTPGTRCTPETMAVLHRFAQKVIPNLRAQIIYQ